MLHSMRQFDDLTYVHSVNVALIASILGQWLKFSEKDIRILTISGLLHDIGKIMIPNEILTKPGKLTVAEYNIMKQHVNFGYEKVKNQNIDIRIKEACLLHHEKCDGTGYPFGLKSDHIPAVAKIIAIADVYDAMTSARVYRGALCPFEVIDTMYKDAFTKFEPEYILPFLKNVASSYINNDVRLSDGRIGKVVLINETYPRHEDSQFLQFYKNYLAHAWRYFSLVAIPPRMCLSCLLTSRTFLASLASSGLISISRVVTSLCAVLLLTLNTLAVCLTVALCSIM